MSKLYRLVVFDWEGTLGDTLGQIFSVVASEAKRLHFGEFDKNLARELVGFGLVKSIKTLFPNLNLQQQETLLSAASQSMSSRASEVYLIPGAKEIVQKIHDAGICLAIATNKNQQSLQRALLQTGLEGFFKITRCAGETLPKPSPQMLEEILFELSINSNEALMVGDSVSDIEMAKSLGVDVIAVSFYHQEWQELQAAGPLDVLDNYTQLADYLGLATKGKENHL